MMKNVLNKNDNSNKEKKKIKIKKKEESCIIFTSPFEEPIVSLFENFYSKEPIREVKLSSFLHTRKFKEKVELYRTNTDEKIRKKIKESIECVTPSGTFNQRRESALIKHTNLLCIDIDSKDNRMVDLPECKAILGEYFNSLYYAGVSIGGDEYF